MWAREGEDKYNNRRRNLLQSAEETIEILAECESLSNQLTDSNDRIQRLTERRWVDSETQHQVGEFRKAKTKTNTRIQQFDQQMETELPRLARKTAEMEQYKSEIARLMKETEISVMEHPPRLPRPADEDFFADPRVLLQASKLALSLGSKSRFCKRASAVLSIFELILDLSESGG